jgi:hypothetical protein
MGWFPTRFHIITFPDKIGYLFNSSLFNSTTSTIGVAFTAAHCSRSFFKGVASPMPWCKFLYFSASALNGVSCVTNGACLIYGLCPGPIPLLAGSVAYGTSVGARACNSLADCMDPAAGLSGKAVDTCIDLATKNWS